MERKRRGRGLRAVGVGLALGLAATAGWPAPAAPDGRERLAQLQKAGPAEHKAALEAGGKLARFCANCHEGTRAGEFAEVPKLAGQNPLYLLGQLEAFRSGRRSGTSSATASAATAPPPAAASTSRAWPASSRNTCAATCCAFWAIRPSAAIRR